MVGLAELQKYSNNLKRCKMVVNNKYCYFYLSGANTYDFLDVLNYKSWLMKTYSKSVNVRYVNVVKKLEKGNVVLRTSIGFGPLLLRFLGIKGYKIDDSDLEVFKARQVVFPDLKIRLYDFQERMVQDWRNAGGIGVIKAPTGAGKSLLGCAIVKIVGRKTLILVHTSDLLINVWVDTLTKAFGPGIMEYVGVVGGGLTERDRMVMKIGARSNDFEENMKKEIVIATFQTLVNHMDELPNYKFGLMINDETHHCPSKMFRKINTIVRAPYKLGLSATIKRLDGLERDIFGQLGDVQSKVSIRELINKGILAEPRFQSPIIVDTDIMDKIERSGLGGLNLSRFVKKMSASSTKKKDYIIDICKNIAARGRKFLLFTDYVAAEDVYVRDLYARSILEEGINVSIIDQEMTSEERSAVFNYLETGQISGIVFGKLGSEGINIPSVDVVIMANGIKCVSGDTLVPTTKGLIRAEKLYEINPEEITTIDSKNMSIVKANINKFFDLGEEDSIRISSNNGYEIEGSFSHLIITRDEKDNIIYKSLSEISIGDEVLICGSNTYGNDIKLDYITKGKKYKESPLSNNIDKCAMNIRNDIINDNMIDEVSGQKCIKIYYEDLRDAIGFPKNIPFNRLSDLVEHRFYRRGLARPRREYDKKSCKDYYIINIVPGVYYGDSTDSKHFSIYINGELAELLGYIVSECYIDYDNNTIEIVNQNNYIIDRYKYLFKQIFDYDVKMSILKDRNIVRSRCHSKNIIEFLRYLDAEHRAIEKVVPWCILMSSKDIQISFLRALFSGDGGIDFDRNDIHYSSSSKRLCDEIHVMLLNMGIISKKSVVKNEGYISYNIEITSEEADIFMRTIGFSDNRKFIKDINRHNWIRSNVYHNKDGSVLFFDKVVSKSNSRCRLYDMNIDKYHSFIGGGFCNHNSPITFCQRVGRAMRRVPGKDFCDVFEILIDTKMELKWSEFNFSEYREEGFQKLVYKVE